MMQMEVLQIQKRELFGRPIAESDSKAQSEQSGDDRFRRAAKRPKALTRPHSSFDGAMILFHDVVQAPDWTASAAPSESPASL
jgi:hypothetical protein